MTRQPSKNEKEYRQNKILYSLNKINYHASKLKGEKGMNELSKIYSVLMTYGKEVRMDILVRLTGLTTEQITPHLSKLKDMGCLDWEGEHITDRQEIKVKPQFYEWYTDLMKKIDQKERSKCELKFTEKAGESAKVTAFLQETPKENEEWVEINYSEGVILKVKKSKIKEVFL